MDAYDVLQISRDATLDEAEAAYHRLLRVHHPDVHASRGPEAVAEAEAHTRQLNEAIAVLRRSIPWRGPVPPGGWIDPPAAPPTEESTSPARCPICDAPVTSLAEFERHLARRHGQLGMQRRVRTRSSRLDRATRWLVDAWYTAPVIFAAFPAIVAYWLYLEVLELPPVGARRSEGGYGLVAFLSITAFWALRTTIPRRE